MLELPPVDPRSFNLCIYVGDDPINTTDSFGHGVFDTILNNAKVQGAHEVPPTIFGSNLVPTRGR